MNSPNGSDRFAILNYSDMMLTNTKTGNFRLIAVIRKIPIPADIGTFPYYISGIKLDNEKGKYETK